MQEKTNERGAIMVEVIAVLALLGTMGTLLFRQMVQRNEELENVNLASEMRIMKEALTAYIQADKASLETTICPLPNNYNENDIHYCGIAQGTIAEKVSYFVPEGYASTVNSYNFYISTYLLDSNIAPRQVFYGMIFPKTNDLSPLPANMNLLRAARIATLIGAEGGVYYGAANNNSKVVNGTLGGWELDCPNDAAACPDDEPMYAAITGTDVFIPEAEQPDAPVAKVALPESVAFSRLHSYDYFSVGDGSKNCIDVCYDTQNKPVLCRELDTSGSAKDDTIYEPGYPDDPNNLDPECDPLFWVGSQNNDYNKSKSGQVYVKNNLYIGRDNANNRHAVSIERDDEKGNKIRVFSPDGTEKLTLNSKGQIIARDNAQKETIRIDGEKGEIALNEREVTINFNGQNTKISIPSVLIGSNGIKMDGMTIHNNGLIETKEKAAFYDDNEKLVNTTYRLDPAYTSLMNDIRLTSRGGARLSDILPNYIMQNVSTHQFNDNNVTSWEVDKPKCPKGYAKAIIVTPTAWSQYVKSAELKLSDIKGTISASDGNGSHTHDIEIDDISFQADSVIDDSNGDYIQAQDGGNELKLTHRGAVVLEIDGTDTQNGMNTPKWLVSAKYEDGPAYEYDPITVMAQTYCVFDKKNFTTGGFNVSNPSNSNMKGNYNYDTTAPSAAGDGIMDSSGAKTEYRSSGTITSNECTDNNDCSITSYCNSDSGTCTELGGPCKAGDNPPTDSNAQCIEGQWLSISCVEDTDCNDTSKKCIGYRCISTSTQ